MKSQAKIQETIALFHTLQKSVDDDTPLYWKEKALKYEEIIGVFVELHSSQELLPVRKVECDESLQPERKAKLRRSSDAMLQHNFAQKFISPVSAGIGAVKDGISDHSKGFISGCESSDGASGEKGEEKKKKRILKRHASNPPLPLPDFISRVTLTSSTELSLTERSARLDSERGERERGDLARSRSKERPSSNKIEKPEVSRERPRLSRLDSHSPSRRALEIRKEPKPRTHSASGPLPTTHVNSGSSTLEPSELELQQFPLPAHGKFGRKKINRLKSGTVHSFLFLSISTMLNH